jgi:hypothetical protein
MEQSVSWVMEYHRRPSGTPDRVGGLPGHLPYVWPRCQICQGRMAFVGHLYASDWFPLGNHLALQFYVCDECRVTFGKEANDRVPIHMEVLPRTAAANTVRGGVRCPSQPVRYISYTPVEDSMDQWTFIRRKPDESELPDKHLRSDKIGGLFPYDGYECKRITKQNRMIAQFIWQGINGPVYLYQSTKEGVYLYHYR